jgi:hypothetical protein
MISFLAWICLDASSFLRQQLVILYSLIVAELLRHGWVTQEAIGATRLLTSDLLRLVAGA